MEVDYYNVEENKSGDKFWMKNGVLHRLDGPAVLFANGHYAWFKEGVLHRTDGPAVDCGGENKMYWIDGSSFTFDQFNEITNQKL